MGLLSVSQLKDPICFAGTTGKSAPPICRLHRLTAPKFSKKIHEFSKKKKLKFADLSRLGAPSIILNGARTLRHDVVMRPRLLPPRPISSFHEIYTGPQLYSS